MANRSRIIIVTKVATSNPIKNYLIRNSEYKAKRIMTRTLNSHKLRITI
jgi:hypothetical protein